MKEKKKGLLEFLNNTKVLIAVLTVSIVLIGVGVFIIVYNAIGVKSIDDTHWYKEQVNSTAIPSISSFGGLSNSESSIADIWNYGNDFELYAKNADVAYDDNYIYFADPTEGGQISRLSRNTPYKREKISLMHGENLSVLDGKIYFLNFYTADGYKSGIYRMDIDGKNIEFLMEGRFWNLRVVNDWVYYTRERDNILCKFQLDTRKEIELTQDACYSEVIYKNNIYYTETPETEDGITFNIVGMDVDGNNRRVLANLECLEAIGDNFNTKNINIVGLTVMNDKLYYVWRYLGYGWIDMEAEGDISVDEMIERFTLCPGVCEMISSYGDEVVYCDCNADYRTAFVGDELRYIDKKYTDAFEIVGDILLFTWKEDMYKGNIAVYDLVSGEAIDVFN